MLSGFIGCRGRVHGDHVRERSRESTLFAAMRTLMPLYGELVVGEHLPAVRLNLCNDRSLLVLQLVLNCRLCVLRQRGGRILSRDGLAFKLDHHRGRRVADAGRRPDRMEAPCVGRDLRLVRRGTPRDDAQGGQHDDEDTHRERPQFRAPLRVRTTRLFTTSPFRETRAEPGALRRPCRRPPRLPPKREPSRFPRVGWHLACVRATRQRPCRASS